MSFLSIHPSTKAFLLYSSTHAFIRREVTPLLDVPLAFTNRTGSSVAQPHISVGHAFAKGDVQQAARLALLDGNDNAIALQQDRESYWSDGSLKFAVLSFRAPETYAVDQKISYRLTGTIGQPQRSVTDNTLNNLTTHDFKLRFTDGDCGNDSFTVSVNTIIVNNRVAPAFGLNPLDGYEVIRSGPICSEWRFWSYLHRDRDGAAHAWVKANIWVRAWGASGPYEINGLVTSPNCWGPHPAGTVDVSNANDPPRFAANMALYDGDTALYYWGGPNDSDTITVSVENIFQSLNTVTFPPGITGQGRGIVFSGDDLPVGIEAGYVYWPSQIDNSTYLVTERGMITAISGHAPYIPGSMYSLESTIFKDHTYYVVTTQNRGFLGVAGMGSGPTGNGTFADPPPNWTANTTLPFPASCSKNGQFYGTPIQNWPSSPLNVVVNQVVTGNNLYYQCVQAGTTAGVPLSDWPTIGTVSDGTAVWQAFGSQLPTHAGTTGTSGPSGVSPGDLSIDGTVLWQLVESEVIWYNATASFSGGSGTIAISPMPSVFTHAGVPLVTKEGDPVWVGSGSRPRMLPTHDLHYLFYQTKATPPYRTDLTSYPLWEGWAMGPIRPNDPYYWDISITGDNPGDDRIGYMSHTELNTLLTGDDVGWDHRCRAVALAFMDRWNFYEDERSGWGLVVNNGPDRNGGRYANLGPPAPYAFAYVEPYAHGLLGASTSLRGRSGYVGRYGVGAAETSHLPALWFTPYLRTGDDLYFYNGLIETVAVEVASGYRQDTLNGVNYYGVTTRDGQTRGLAWGTRVLGLTEFVCPSTHAMLPMIADCLDDSANWLMAWVNSIQGTDMWACGIFGPSDNNANVQSWQIAFNFHVLGTLALQGERTGWREFLTNYLVKSAVNLYDSDQGGSDYHIGHNPLIVGSQAGNGINTVSKIWLATINQDPTTTDHPTGIAFGGVSGPDEVLNGLPFPTVGYYLVDYAAIVMAVWLNIPDALKVALRVKKRFDDAGLMLSGYCGGGGSYAGCFSAFPTFAFALPAAPHILLQDSSNILNEDSSILSLEI